MAHLLILVADYYRDITDELTLGAKTHLEASGHSFDVVTVPGAFELPAAIHFAMHSAVPKYDGYIALGCVIRGETSHYEYVCNECARGIQHLAIKHRAAIGFGVLTVEHKAQAQKRANVNGMNKGREAAEAALRMLELKSQWNVQPYESHHHD